VAKDLLARCDVSRKKVVLSHWQAAGGPFYINDIIASFAKPKTI
jgi:hypothetical protein